MRVLMFDNRFIHMSELLVTTGIIFSTWRYIGQAVAEGHLTHIHVPIKTKIIYGNLRFCKESKTTILFNKNSVSFSKQVLVPKYICVISFFYSRWVQDNFHICNQFERMTERQEYWMEPVVMSTLQNISPGMDGLFVISVWFEMAITFLLFRF